MSYELIINKSITSDFFKVDVKVGNLEEPVKGRSLTEYGFLTVSISWLISDNIDQWFKDNNIKYEMITYEELNQSYPKSILFEKESDAVLFKLIWM